MPWENARQHTTQEYRANTRANNTTPTHSGTKARQTFWVSTAPPVNVPGDNTQYQGEMRANTQNRNTAPTHKTITPRQHFLEKKRAKHSGSRPCRL